MSKGRLLIVEDDFDISNMLRIYFDSQGYETIIATRGEVGWMEDPAHACCKDV